MGTEAEYSGMTPRPQATLPDKRSYQSATCLAYPLQLWWELDPRISRCLSPAPSSESLRCSLLNQTLKWEHLTGGTSPYAYTLVAREPEKNHQISGLHFGEVEFRMWGTPTKSEVTLRLANEPHTMHGTPPCQFNHSLNLQWPGTQ